MNREIKARREFDQKWKFMKSSETNKFYSKSYLDEKVTEALGKGLPSWIIFDTIVALKKCYVIFFFKF